MKHILRLSMPQRILATASILAIALLFLFPATSEAHAILLRSDPTRDALLTTAPTQVRMWFTEDLNPTFSTAVVVNSSNQRVDLKNAQVATSGDKREMDVGLQPNLPPSAYIVLWRTQSADDGHILRGSFIFSVAEPDGTAPAFNGSLPGQDALGGSTSNSLATGQLDGSTGFLLVMVTLVDLGVIFWFGAQLWHTFVLQLVESEEGEQQAIYERTERRFERRFALPALIMMLLANVGVLVGQALSLTGGQLVQALSPALLAGLVTTGQFGTFWIMREVVVLLAIAVAAYTILAKHRFFVLDSLIPWVNLVLGLALLLAMVLSGHAGAVDSNIVVYSVLVDWLHLLAASLWIGGMMYIATSYLPVLKHVSLTERVKSLLATLPRYSPLAIAGVLIMALSGPFNATVHLTSWQQLFSTAYGRTLDVKVLLVGAIMLTSAFHVGILRPQLKKSYQQYSERTDEAQVATIAAPVEGNVGEQKENQGSRRITSAVAQQVKQLESGVAQNVQQLETTVDQQTRRLTRVLNYEPLLGVAVLLCTGLLTVFAGTLQPATTGQPPPRPPIIKPYTTTATTTDKKFTFDVKISPNRFGPNVFTITVLDNKGQPVPTDQVGVSLYTTMLDMDMGTSPGLNLQPDGKGHFTGTGDLDMPGNWQLRIQLRTLDNTLHEAKFDFFTPS